MLNHWSASLRIKNTTISYHFSVLEKPHKNKIDFSLQIETKIILNNKGF